MSNKIAFFLPSLKGGGAQKVILNLVEEYVINGFEVDLILSEARGEYLCKVPDNAQLIDLSKSRTLYSLPKLVNYLITEQPCALISAMNYANVVVIIAKLIASLRGRIKTKLIITEHSTLSEVLGYSKKTIFVAFLMRLLYSKSDSVIAVSKGVADDLANVLRISRNKIKVIYNPVVNETLMLRSKEKLNHNLYGNNVPVILSAGRLIESKNFPLLINAFYNLRQNRDAYLVILGEGNKRAELESLVHELGLEHVVCMPGFVENPYSYMSNSDLFVLTSNREGLPTVLVEALACGLSIVSTDCPSGPREILLDGKFGKLVPMNNMIQLVNAIDSALDERKFINKSLLIKRAQDFSVRNIAQQYMDL